jgi:small subunit ribosomal protein S12
MRKIKKYKLRKITITQKSQPQYKGICLKVFLVKPKKPNSALRKAARVQLSSGITINAYIPGIGHNLSQHSLVLVKKSSTQDLPGFNFKVIRGVLDCSPVKRERSRSKYGCKRSL